MFSSFNREENGGEGDMPALLLPDREGKLLSRKSLKKLSSFPCSKHPRTDQTKDEAMAAGANSHESLSSKKTGYDHLRCVSDEKYQIVKQKRGQDFKRMDRKSFKASVKTKFDSVSSKTAFISSDSACGGINTIGTLYKAGICGLKSQLHDLTRHVEELSLDELLDGSCTYANSEKGEKVSNDNENILLSVRKACSILHVAVDSVTSSKPLTSLQNPSLSLANLSDQDEKDNCTKELSSKDSHQGKFSTSTMYQPKDFLERLAFPPTIDLEAFAMNLTPKCIMHMKAFNSSSLPPFPWSFSHGGTCKLGVDSCKFNLPRSTGQSKWLRIKSSFALSVGGNNCFSGLEGKTVNRNDEFANKQMIELLEEARSLIESSMPIFDGPQHISESNVLDHSNSIIRSGSLHSGMHEALDGHAETSGNHEEDDSKDYLFPQNSESEVDLRCLRNNLVDSSQFDWPCKDSEIGQKEHPRRTTDDYSQSCNGYPSKSFTEGCGRGLWHSPTSELSKQGHSPQLLAAAAVLCEMASSSNGIKAQNDTGVRIKSPPSQKYIKDRKSTSVKKQERLFLASRHHQTFKRSAPPSSPRHKLIGEKNIDFVPSNNLGRESEKWFLSSEVGYAPPRKLEKDYLRANHRLLHGNSMRPSSLMQSPIQVEKVYESFETRKRNNEGPIDWLWR